jgi:hypothetical protein
MQALGQPAMLAWKTKLTAAHVRAVQAEQQMIDHPGCSRSSAGQHRVAATLPGVFLCFYHSKLPPSLALGVTRATAQHQPPAPRTQKGTWPQPHQYSSSAQRPTQKTWKTKKGASICSRSSSRKAGTGTSNLLGPQRSSTAATLASVPYPLAARYVANVSCRPAQGSAWGRSIFLPPSFRLAFIHSFEE